MRFQPRNITFTADVRSRFEQLQQDQGNQHNCVWSNKSLKQKYAINHCMPFSRWLNNDLWNLLPSDVKVNGQKSDCIEQNNLELNRSKRFFTELNIALPGLEANNNSVDELFEALLLRRGRLKEMQQLREW